MLWDSVKYQLLGKHSSDVTFSNKVFGIMITLHLDNGETLVVLAETERDSP